MRPGQTAPEFRAVSTRRRARRRASMRPGQTAPEFNGDKITFVPEAEASMRPGQTAPEFMKGAGASSTYAGGFNEAGADCPGILFKDEISLTAFALLQ